MKQTHFLMTDAASRTSGFAMRFMALLLLCLMMGAGTAWAQRLEPTYSASLDRNSSNWYYIKMVNRGNDGFLYSQGGSQHIKHGSNSVQSPSYIWQLVGDNTSGFMLVSLNGYYGYWDNGFLSGTTDASLAAKFTLDNGNDSNSWGVKKYGETTGYLYLNPQGSNEIKTWSNDGGSRVQFAAVSAIDLSAAVENYESAQHHWNEIKYSDSPSATGWAANTYWFKVRNNRNNQNAQYNRTYLSTSAESVNADCNMFPLLTTMPNDRGSYWCFVGDNTNGFVIQNAAYGPEFVLGIYGNNGQNNTVQMVPKSNIPSGYNTVFTAVDNNVIDGATHAYAFRIGTSGNVHVHVTNGNFYRYNHTAITGGDTGSAFKLTFTESSVVNALTAYDVYKVETTGNARVTYNRTRAVFGKRNFSPYFILAQGGQEINDKQYIQAPRDIESFSYNFPTTSYIKQLYVALAYPVISHRRSYLFDKLDTTPDSNLPGAGYIQKGTGMVKNPFTNTDIQYISDYTITQYLKHGVGKQLFMPTIDGNNSEVTAYQRWYDYKTETMPNTQVINIPSLVAQAETYANGVVVGSNNNRGSIVKNATATLPSNLHEYWLGVDQSRYNDGSNDANGNLTEPSLTMRVIYHLVDAKVMADKMNACTLGSNNWEEEHTIAYPNKKLWNGNNSTKSGVDYIGLNHEFSNYWCYDGNGTADANLVQMVDGKLVVELDAVNSTANLTNVRILANGQGGIANVQGFARNRFISFQYPKVGDNYEVPIGSVAYINVYMQHNSTKYQLARIKLEFIANAEPMLLTEVYGKDENDVFKSQRSMEAMKEAYGDPVSELTFDHAAYLRFECPTAQNQGNKLPYNDEAYAFPLDFKQSSYAYHGAPWASRGEYIFRNAGTIGGKAFYPIDSYKSAIHGNKNTLSASDKQAGKYFLYVDASEQPGQVMSIPIQENLCAGSRMYCYGWFNSATQLSQESVGILLNIVGKKSNGESDVIYSYNPGLLSTVAFNSDNEPVENLLGAAPWRQVGFTFLIDGSLVSTYESYELQVMNNCYSTNGGDFTLDNFYIFVNPPKGEVDFTIPLCSDQVRHAKIHADYDMLRDLSGLNDQLLGAYITASYCFVEADVFDNYSEGGLTIKDIFELDSRGNYNLKPGYNTTDTAVKTLINNAFGKALVGSRKTKESGAEDHGFHSYQISTNYESIKPYAYHDSKSDEIYREIDETGVRRIVFKEDVVRGEMQQVQDPDGHLYYPHMRPSTVYYLIFSPFAVDQTSIEHHSVATDVFKIQESCSFLGKFKTKDPMHVILDNADIVSDLPVQAVCHGETVNMSFNMPALKDGQPIYDAEYCISDQSKDGQEVPGVTGHHYKYESSFNDTYVQTTVKNMPYDWWLGGKYDDTHTFGGSYADYAAATHPTIKYNHDLSDPNHQHTHAPGYKQHNTPVDIALALKNLRFYYPDFGNETGDTPLNWDAIFVHDYDNDSGYSLLQSEINTLKDLVEKGIIVLHRTSYDIAMSVENSTVKNGKNVIEFTLVPIMPSLRRYVDEPYIICPEPRGVTITLRDAAPKMLNGFGDKTYPADMENVPVRAGLQQLNAVSQSLTAATGQTLRVPLRGLAKALDEGKYLMPYVKTSANVDVKTVFLVDTNDPVYEAMFDANQTINAWGKVIQMQAEFGRNDNFMDLIFNEDYKMREGFTYRIGVRFVEVTDDARTTRDIACDGTLYFDLKVVPEYQVWTGLSKDANNQPVNVTEWTNDRNWARADRSELFADNVTTGNVITAATDYKIAANYPTNDDNFGVHHYGADSLGFMPMYFTNVLFNDSLLAAPVLTTASVASDGFLTITTAQGNRSGFEHHTMIDHAVAADIAYIKNETAATSKKVHSIVYDMNVTPVDASFGALAMTSRYAAHTGNYGCEPFGTNVAKGITFAPRTQLINAQHLTYYKAWVEYELDVNRWYTLGSPLQNTFAGEWYAPTKGAQQNSPYFYDVKYVQREGTGASATGHNDRFRPPSISAVGIVKTMFLCI